MAQSHEKKNTLIRLKALLINNEAVHSSASSFDRTDEAHDLISWLYTLCGTQNVLLARERDPSINNNIYHIPKGQNMFRIIANKLIQIINKIIRFSVKIIFIKFLVLVTPSMHLRYLTLKSSNLISMNNEW